MGIVQAFPGLGRAEVMNDHVLQREPDIALNSIGTTPWRLFWESLPIFWVATKTGCCWNLVGRGQGC